MCLCCLPPVTINGESHESTAEPFVMSGGRLRRGVLDSLPCWGFLFLLATHAKSPYRSTAQCAKALERHWGGTKHVAGASSHPRRDIAEQREGWARVSTVVPSPLSVGGDDPGDVNDLSFFCVCGSGPCLCLCYVGVNRGEAPAGAKPDDLLCANRDIVRPEKICATICASLTTKLFYEYKLCSNIWLPIGLSADRCLGLESRP